MNSKTRKRGFTIVELVIVIAVIGILTAVLIPTFSSLISRAHTSADVVTARNMNTALHSTAQDFNTVEEVKDYLEAQGYSKNVAPATSGNYYVWDRTNNQIIIAKNQGTYAIGVWPSNYEGKTSESAEWYRYVDYVITVSATELEDYTVSVFSPTLKLAGNEVENEIVINGLANMDFTGHTLPLGLTVITNARGGFYIENCIVNTKYIIDAPNASLTHNKNTTVSVDESSINVANHSYYLYGKFVSNKVKLEEVSHLVIDNAATFYANTINVEATANPTITTKVEEDKKTLTKADLGFNATTTEVAGNTVVEIIDTQMNEQQQKADEKIVGIEVSTKEELDAAMVSGGNIILKADIESTSPFTAEKPFNIYGNNHKITVDGTTSKAARVLNIWGNTYEALNNTSFIIQDVELELVNTRSDTRGLNICGNYNTDITLNNVKIKANYYAINIIPGTSKLNLVLNNCEVTGWAAINSYAEDSTFTIYNSTLTGINNKSYNADGWNNYGVVVIDGGSLFDLPGAKNVALNVIGSTIVAQTVENASGNANTQYHLSLQYGSKYVGVYVMGSNFVRSNIDKDSVETRTESNEDCDVLLYDYTHEIYLEGEKVFPVE